MLDLPGIDAARWAALPREQKLRFVRIAQERKRRISRRSFYSLFPAETTRWQGPKTAIFQHGPGETIYARELYPRHMEHFAAGKTYRERCFMAANRVGKTVAGGYEDACHLTGLYEDWWPGRRFANPTDGWVAGKTNETTRDILQGKLLGPISYRSGHKGFAGTGLIPGDLIGEVTWKQGVPNLVDTVKVRHKTGGWSVLGFKSYQQGRGAFEGTERDFIHLDEEPPLDIYGECLIRTATTGGIVYLTFTPLEGLSEVVLGFMPDDMRPATD